MTVTYDSYFAKAVSYAIEMIAVCPTMVTLAGTSTPKGITIESFGGLSPGVDQYTTVTGATVTMTTPPTANFCVVHEGEVESQEIALHTFGYSGSVKVDLYTLTNAADTPPEILRRARNYSGGLKAELDALFGFPGFFQRGYVNITGTQIPDETSDLNGLAISSLTINWSSP